MLPGLADTDVRFRRYYPVRACLRPVPVSCAPPRRPSEEPANAAARQREPGLARALGAPRVGRRHDDRPRLQPHLPGREDQGHRGLVREPRHEAGHPARVAREPHRARRRTRPRGRPAHPAGRGRRDGHADGCAHHQPSQGGLLRLPASHRGVGVPDEPHRRVHRDRCASVPDAGRSTTRSASIRAVGGASPSSS